MAEKPKPLPHVILQDIEKDAATGMTIRDHYVSIQAHGSLDTLLNKAKKTLEEMKR